MVRFVNPIPFVRDIAAARDFWRDVVGLSVKADHGDFVLFEGGFALHDGAALTHTVFGVSRLPSEHFGSETVLFYFEDDDVDAAFVRIAPHVTIIHPVQRQPWGQRVFRFRDPEGYLIEIGEPMEQDQ
jgi:catechol 2,3-dioxygenase-like lactoylglutathione lyase family enzyme